MRSGPGDEEHQHPAWWEERYLSGNTPWDTGITPPEVVWLVESGRVPTGWALDLGCGSGVTSRHLASNGFRVIGVDLSLIALKHAARLAAAERLPCYFVRGSVQDFRFLRIDAALAVDIGCFHSLSPAERTSYVRSLGERVISGGYYLLYTFVRPPHEQVSPEVGGLNVVPSDIGAFAPWFALRCTAYGEDRGRVSAWFLMQRT